MDCRLAVPLCVIASTVFVESAHGQDVLPVLDVHIHALAANAQGPPPVWMCTPFEEVPYSRSGSTYGQTWQALREDPPCADPLWSPTSDREVRDQTIAVMKRHNVYGVLSGTPARVADWSAAAPGRFIPGLGFNVASSAVTPDSLRRLHADGRVEVLAEVGNQYAGVAPDDPLMEPYWALAEELDLPVGIHIGPGPPGVIYLGSSGYRARLHSALTMEEVLVRHPGLRVYIMHAGFPMVDDLLALLYAHPQVYVGVGVIVYSQPREVFYGFLRRIVDAGFGSRVLFGSDQMVWPESMAVGIQVIQEANFLSNDQKRAILYENAARFLDITPEQRQAHHAPLP